MSGLSIRMIATGAASLACAASLLGCCPRPTAPVVLPPPAFHYDYVMVEYAAATVQSAAPPAEVRDTPTYRDARASIASVAIRFPDRCVTATAAQATGVARSSDAILTSVCAVWLSELERSLSRHYRVISWDALYRLEQSNRTSTYQAAQQLGADIVFVINSLEANNIRLGARAGASLSYFRSDERGSRGEPLVMEQDRRAVFRQLVVARTPRLDPEAVVALAATLDTTAIITRSGESAWFFRRGITRRLGRTDTGVRFLFMGVGEQWRPVLPRIASVAQQAVIADRSAQDTVGVEVQRTDEDPYAAEKLELIRSVVDDFVVRFRGTGG